MRTLDSSALEFLHAMSVENIWPNKVEYSLVIPRKAIAFGTFIPLEVRLTPLLKGLDVLEISARLLEIHDIVLQGPTARRLCEHRRERQVASWAIDITRERYWGEIIEGTGQEGWFLVATLELPRKLGRCLQDVNAHGIKVRHKLKIVVSLKNPGGHISEVRIASPFPTCGSQLTDHVCSYGRPFPSPSSSHQTSRWTRKGT